MTIDLHLLERCLEIESSDLHTVPNLTELTMETDVEMRWTSTHHASMTLDLYLQDALRHRRLELSLLHVGNRYTHHHHHPFTRSLLVMPTLIDAILVIDGITLKIDSVHSVVLMMTIILELIGAYRPQGAMDGRHGRNMVERSLLLILRQCGHTTMHLHALRRLAPATHILMIAHIHQEISIADAIHHHLLKTLSRGCDLAVLALLEESVLATTIVRLSKELVKPSPPTLRAIMLRNPGERYQRVVQLMITQAVHCLLRDPLAVLHTTIPVRPQYHLRLG